jgi:HlyD family secretion protein
MNKKTLRWLGGALAALALAACKTGQAAEESSKMATTAVTRGDLTVTAEATGTVEPVRSVEVKSKASGEILRLHVDVGDEVSSGALLAEVDPRDVRNRFEQAQADLEVANARTEIGKAQIDRSRELLAGGVITQQEFESARLDYANALASQVKAKTNQELAQLQLSDVTIRAPMKGTIISKTVEEGQVIQSASGNVSGGTTLFTMANLDSMQVRTLVDETDMGQIKARLQATVKVEAFPDRTFSGVVEKIEPQAEVQQNVTMFPVIVSLDNRAGLLKPGMNAEVEVLVDRAADVLLVPNNAVVRMQDVGPAALALGLDVESMDLSQFMQAGRPGASADRPAGAQAGAQGQPAEGEAMRTADPAPARTARTQTATGTRSFGGPQVDSLRARVERGEITQDSMRVLLRSMRDAGAWGAAADGEGGTGERTSHAAVVFVLGPDSVPTPRVVQIGLNDWDNSQVVSGLEGNETLVLVSAAQLQAQQQEFLDRMRSRMGGSPFGGGGGPGPGRR